MQQGITIDKHTLNKLVLSWFVGKEYGGSTADNYHFLDGATDPESHLKGPVLLHYRLSARKDDIKRQKDSSVQSCRKQFLSGTVIGYLCVRTCTLVYLLST